MTKEQLLSQYKKSLKSFCKEYRSFYIPASQNVEELQDNNQNKGISMINIFTPLSVVPRKEDRKGKADMEAGFDVDEMIRNIDRKIYELDLEELEEKAEVEVEKTSIPVFLTGVKRMEKEALPDGEEKDFYIMEYRLGPLHPEIYQMIVNASASVIKDYQESTFYLLKGAFIRKNGFEYFLLEPEEWEKGEAEVVENVDEEKKTLIPGQIILSSPGGGKTTLLQMITYAYLNHEMLPNFKKEEEEDCNQLREKLGIEGKYFPVFIRIRDLAEELLSKTEDCPEFDKIILWAMQSFVEEEGCHEMWEEILKEIMEKHSLALLIDGIDELESSRQEAFLQKLEVYLDLECQRKQNMVYISARHANYRDNEINRVLQSYYIEEYVIESLSNNYALVETFARNWYKCVFEHDKKKQRNVETAFLRPIKNDSNLQKLITNPLELTNLLIISSGEGYLPTDRNQIYEGAIELQLKWNHSRNLDPIDVEFQLAYLAYQMSVSTSERIVIGESRLIDIISEARQELKRYFRSKQSLEREDIKDFVYYIVGNTCILQKSSSALWGAEPQYEFHHLQYQAFLTAFCITKGLFSKKNRKADKLDYFEGCLNLKDDIGSQVIVLAAMQDIHMRDDIIEALLNISKEDKKQNQSVAMLLQLMAVPGINFDSEEKQMVANMLVEEDTDRLDLFRNKREDIQWMLLNNTVSENKDFIHALLKRAERTEGAKKENYLEQIASIIFFVIWECSVDEEDIRRVMEGCFRNWITQDLMSQIKNTFLRGQENQKTISLIFKMGEESLKLMKQDEEKATDYFMIIATICCHQEGKNPYEIVREKMLSTQQIDKIIGVNLLFLLAWMHQTNKQDLLNAPRAIPEEIMENIRQVLLDAVIKNDYMAYDFEATYRDVLQNQMVDRSATRWYPESIFHIECQKLFLLEEITGDERPVEILANYPLNRRTLRMGEQEKMPEHTRELLKEYLDRGKDQMKIKAFKILVFLYQKDDKEQKMKFYFEALKRKFWVLNSVAGGVRAKSGPYKEFEKLLLEVGELYLEDKKWYTENPGRQYYLDSDPVRAATAFKEAFAQESSRIDLAFLLRRSEIRSVKVEGKEFSVAELLGEDENDAFVKINQALLIHNHFNNIDQSVMDTLLMTSYTKNYVEAVLWWKHLLNKGDPEGARVIYALYCAAQRYICEEDVQKAKTVLRFQNDLKELEREERLFIYTDENGERLTGKTVLEFVDVRTGETYLLYRKNALSEKIYVGAAKFRMNGDEGTLVLPENERDNWAVEAIWDIVRQRLSQ